MQLTTLHKIFGAEAGEGFMVKTGGVYVAAKGIVPRHKADISFFTGLAHDADPASELKYPAFLLDPVTLSDSISPTGEVSLNWSLIAGMVDLLPEDRSPEDYNIMLNRNLEILREIIFQFLYEFGNTSKEVKYDNIEAKVDIQLTSPISYLPIIDETAENRTGWQATFTITEQLKFNDCCYPTIFEAL